MPCGSQMIGRVDAPANRDRRAAPGITGGHPCLGPGRVEPSERDRRRLHTLLVWIGWAIFAVAAAAVIVTLL